MWVSIFFFFQSSRVSRTHTSSSPSHAVPRTILQPREKRSSRDRARALYLVACATTREGVKTANSRRVTVRRACDSRLVSAGTISLTPERAAYPSPPRRDAWHTSRRLDIRHFRGGRARARIDRRLITSDASRRCDAERTNSKVDVVARRRHYSNAKRRRGRVLSIVDRRIRSRLSRGAGPPPIYLPTLR